MQDEEVLVWDKQRGAHLDYLRVERYEFTDPTDSFGKPDVDKSDITIYGWTNAPYDPTQDKQSRSYLALHPDDLGGHDFDIDEWEHDLSHEYPRNAIDAHNIEPGNTTRIEEPTPKFDSGHGYELEEIPDRIHSKDHVRFSDAEVRDFSIELDASFRETIRLSLDREFSTYTLLRMREEIEGFELPRTIKKHFLASHI